jgi:hypothetical protein
MALDFGSKDGNPPETGSSRFLGRIVAAVVLATAAIALMASAWLLTT